MYSYLGYLLFLFLFFPYCIVGPTNMYIYPSPMCIINSFSITKIRDFPFSLFSHGIRVQGEKNPNYFRFIREFILGNISVTVFHSGHLSHLFSHGIRVQGEKNPNYFRFIREFILGNISVTVFHSWSPFSYPKAFRSTVSPSENPHRHFPMTFSGEVLFRH